MTQPKGKYWVHKWFSENADYHFNQAMENGQKVLEQQAVIEKLKGDLDIISNSPDWDVEPNSHEEWLINKATKALAEVKEMEGSTPITTEDVKKAKDKAIKDGYD